MTALATTALAYAVGCISPGYHVVRRLTGGDPRRYATGSTGARNVGRIVGVRGAAVTLAADVAKGAAAVAIARTVSADAAAASLPAVVAGHVAPVQLRFRGGRGLGPALGGLLILDWRVAIVALAVAAACAAATRELTAAGLAGAAAAPVAAVALGEMRIAVSAAVAVAIVAAAHMRRGAAA